MNSTTSTLRNANRRQGASRTPPRLRYKHLAFGVGFALGSLLVVGVASAASGVAATQTPTGGQVVGGVGSIAQRGASTIVNQQSSLLSLNWQSFNVGKDASVLFKQPGLSAVALNRILDQNPSQIFGKISSNGQVFLINTHGIIFGASAQLNVGGLVASTLDLTPSDFLKRHFDLNANGGNAAVVNHGTIAAASGGSVSLVGGQVENDGLILANYGHINLDGADQAVLNFDGDGLINVEITGALKQRFDADQAAVVNKGTLQANSGTVVLQASAAKNLFTNLVNNSGVIDAHGISTAGGVVRLVGSGGNVIDSGNINVSGTSGGSAQLLSDQNVGVMGGTIDASGTNGGGSIRVGGGWQGGEGLQTASATYIAPDATLNASATQLGNGGSVVVWGNNVNNFFGSIFARGGAYGGDGGRVETSSHYGLNAQGSVDASAPHGVAGLWLLDPYDVTINSTGTGTIPANGKFTASGTSQILNTNLNAALTTGTKVYVFTNNTQAGNGTDNGDITVAAPITAAGSGASLYLEAAGSIFVNNTISGANAGSPLNVFLWGNYGGTAAGSAYSHNATCVSTTACQVTFGYDTGSTTTSGNGQVNTDGGKLDIETTGAVNFGSTNYTGGVNTGTGTLNIVGGSVTELNGSMAAGTLTGTVAGSVSLGSATNAITDLGAFTAVGFSLTNGQALDVTGAVDAGTGNASLTTNAGDLTVDGTGTNTGSVTGSAVDLTAGAGNLAINGAVNSGAGTTTLTQTGTGAITENTTTGKITAGTLTGSSAGATTLASASNAITNLGAFTAVGFSLTNGQALDVTGTVNAETGNASLTTSTGDLTIDGTGTNNGSVTGSAVGLTASAGNLAINGAVNSGTGTTTLTQAGTGAITEDATSGKIIAATLTGTSVGDTTLDGNNQITTLGSFGAKDLALTNAAALTVAGPISTTGGTGNISFTTTSGNALTVSQALTGGAITLDSGSNLTVGQGVTGTSVDLAANGNLAINAAVDSGTGTTTLTQTGTGAITENTTTGKITAGTLTGSSVGATTLGSATNAITDLGAFTAVGFSLTNGQALDVTGVVNAETGNASLTTNAGDLTIDGTGTHNGSVAGSSVGLTASAGNLAINGAVNSGTGTTTLTQAGTGAITEDATSGKIIAATLTGTSVGDTTLDGNNQITTLGSFGAKDLALTNAAALTVAGPISTTGGTGNISLTTTTGNMLSVGGMTTGGALTLDSGSDLTVAQAISGSSVNLGANGNLAINAAVDSGTGTTTLTQTGIGSISENSAGVITAGTLQGNAAGTVSLGGNNLVADLGNFSANGFSLNNAQALSVTGAVDGGTGNAALTTTTGDLTLAATGATTGNSVSLTSAGNLVLGGAVNAGTGTATLVAGNGAITESGSITAGTLTGSSTGSTTLGSASNAVSALGNFTAVGFSLTNAGALSVIGAVNASTGLASLATTGAGNDLTVTSAGAVSGAAVDLASGSNLAINGTVNSGTGATTLTQTGTGAITENATNGKIIAATLTGSSTGDTTLAGNNQVATLGAFTAKDFALVDNANLTVAGPLGTTGGNGNISLTTTAGHTLGVGQVATSGAVTLDSGSDLTVAQGVSGSAVTLGANGNLAINAAVNSGGGTTTLTQTGTGAITEDTTNGSITAGTLTGSSIGATTLNGANNAITALGAFTASGFSLTNAQALDVTGAVNAGAGAASLTTTAGGITVGGSVTGGAVGLASAGNIAINGTVDSTASGGTGTTTLNAVGAISEAVASGVVKASKLTGGSTGDTTLGGNNQVVELDAFNARDLTLVNDANLSVVGPISTTGGSGNISFTTTLGHTLDVGQVLTGGDITLDSGSDLTVAQAITGSAVTLGANGNLAINAAVNSGTGATTLTQSGSGAITEDLTNGSITAGTLTGSSTGDTTLNGNNQIAELDAFSAQDFALIDAHDLNVVGPISTAVGTGSISLTTTAGNTLDVGQMSTGGALTLNSGSDLTVAQNVTGASVNLAANGNLAINATVNSSTGTTTLTQSGTGAITEDTANGAIVAGKLTGSSTGDTTLGGNNQVAELDAFSAKDLTLVNAANLAVVGPISTAGGNGNIDFTTTLGHTLDVGQVLTGGNITLDSGSDLDIVNAVTGSAVNLAANGNLAINAAVNSGAGATTLTQTGTGAITEDAGNGKITAATLTGSSSGDTTLGGNNQVGELGAFSAKDLTFVNAANLSVVGPISTTTGNGNISLTTTAGNGLSVGQMSTGGALTLNSGSDLTVAQDVAGGSVNLAANGNLAINATVNSGTGTTTLTQTGVGAITENPVNGVIVAGKLTGTSAGDTTLGGNNQIGELDAFNAKDLTLVDAHALNVVGPITTVGGIGNISLTTTTGNALGVGQMSTGGTLTLNSGSDLTVAQNIAGSTVNLGANGNLAIDATVNSGAGTTTLTQTGAGAITENAANGVLIAGHLTGSSTGDTTLGGNNQIVELDGFNAKDLSVVDAHDLSVVGPITTTSGTGTISFTTLPGFALNVGQVLTGGAITLDSGKDLSIVNNVTGSAVTLAANGNLAINAAVNSGAGTTTLTQTGTGAITENASGSIVAGTLTGSSAGATTLGGAANQIASLGSFSANGFSLTDNHGLTVLAGATVNGGNSVQLTTTGAGSNLALDGHVQATQVQLNSAGSIAEGAAGLIQAATLSGSSVGATALGATNAIGSLGNFTAVGFALMNGQALTIADGATVNGGSSAAITTTGGGSDLTINGTLAGTATKLTSSGGIGEGANGAIITSTLTGSSSAATSLSGDNQVANLGNFTADGFALNDAQSLAVAAGATVDGGNATSLSTTGSGSNLAVNGTVTGTTTTLRSAGAISEGAGGSIHATTLTGSATNGAQLTGTNAVANLGNFSAQGIAITNGQSLTVANGATVDGGASTTLTTTGAGGNLAINGTLKGATTTLLASGAVSEGGNGSVQAGTLTGSSVGSTTLASTHNNVTNLGNFTAAGFNLATASGLTVAAGSTVNGGSSTTLAATGAGGNLAINGNVKGTVTKLAAGGAITEGSAGAITADTLTGSSVGDTTLNSANQVAGLGAFTAANFSLTDAHALAVGGPLATTGSTGNISLVTTGGTGNTLTVNQAVHGGAITMTSAGDLTVANAVVGNQVNLTADGNLAIAAAVDSGSGVVTLTQTGTGSIAGGPNGGITAGTLTGTSTGATDLGSAAQFMGNHVGVLGGFVAPGGFSFTNDQTLTLASVNGSAFTVNAGQSPVYLAVQNGDLLQTGTNWLYDSVGTWSSTGHIGLATAPIYVMGVSNQTVSSIGLPPAYFYAIDAQGNLLPIISPVGVPSSVNVPAAMLSTNAQGVNGHTDRYIDISVISAIYRPYGVVTPGILLPPDQLECPPDQPPSAQCPGNGN
ncbi:MAG TPA: filamentous hemagglutinin N-terminal domain-containing protein [Rhodanobacteraceae bacterium]